ncbi:MAG: glycerate kinase [Candidatus Binataceae bacterium]
MIDPAIRKELERIYRAAIAAVDPALLVGQALDGTISNAVRTDSLIDGARRIFVLAIGKASYAMAAELERRLADRIADGLAVVPPDAAPAAPLTKIRIVSGGHPLPDASSVAAANAAIQMVANASAGDLVIVALSGGASAMFALPAPGLMLEDKIATTSALLRSGAAIRELNCVRKHLSAIKGGCLARSISNDARVVTLILSDVPGDDIATIGSGPTAADPSTFSDAIGILKRRRIWGRAPERVRDYLERGVAGEIPETPKSTDPSVARVTNLIIGSNATALDAAEREAAKSGFAVERWRELKGEADELGRDLGARLGKVSTQRACILAGGEPVVTVHGGGRGGRAQQCALALALELARSAPSGRLAALAAGSDGIDGPTDAAGAFASPDTVERARAKGLDAETALKRNDAYNLFGAIGDLFRTGATGTNVTDLFIALVNY